MSAATARLSELLRAGDPAVWYSMAGMKAVTAAAIALHASSPLNTVTVQIRKATSVAGANAANLGTAVSATYAALQTALTEELGNFNSSTPFTHVSAVITDEKSPNAYSAMLLFEPTYNTPVTTAQGVRPTA